MCKARDIASLPGAMTPTEILRAWHVGADLIRVFPADMVGPQYFRNMLTQLRDLELVAAGGLQGHNLASFLEAGAVAAALSRGLLTEPGQGFSEDLGQITEQARRLREIVEEARA
jgi:2-dehydro-3-deoxyphosphogluconate aldolase/(4S)-4-hydroxy-2-oxoglutarate aldolase